MSLKFQWIQPETGLAEPTQDHEKLLISITGHQHPNWVTAQACS